MKAVKISESVYWVGAIDWSLRNFHGIAAPRGGTYNSYIVIDEKVALIDTVNSEFFEEHSERIKSIMDFDGIDYVISNHSEADHSGSIPKLMEKAKKAKLITSRKGVEYLSRMYGEELPFLTIKDGEEIKLGKLKLRFIDAPMLHWPETMMSYMIEEGILFSCDFFGAQVADSRMFADLTPNIIEHAKRYYALIFRPFVRAVLNGLNKLKGLKIDIIAPSHGPIWRNDVNKIIDAYFNWSTAPEKEKAVIAYAGIWGGTERMAEAIANSLVSSGVEVMAYDLAKLSWDQWSDLMVDFMEAKAIIFGSHTFIGNPFPTVKVALDLLKLINPKGKMALLFGTYGWGGGALKAIANELKEMGINLIEPFLEVQFVPHEEDLRNCFESGKLLAEKIKA
ncbi:MAG: FprA family A-type flavoprotein [Candidatus Bathyarchaeia archaeon]